jgi:predicted Rossmann fold flavoprotein
LTDVNVTGRAVDLRDIVVIGAGAAGMLCAAEAGKRGRSVLVLEHAEAAGKKIRISGGGRCNFTNVRSAPENFLSQNPQFCISALHRYTAADFIALVERYGIAYHEKTLGQLFCDGSAQQVIDLLLAEMKQADAELRLETSVTTVEKTESGFLLTLSPNAEQVRCQSLVVATGGKSIPKMGASDFGYRLATRFGVSVVETRPARLRRADARAAEAAGRNWCPGARDVRRYHVRRSDAVHASGFERTGDSADFLLLASRR